MRPVASVLLACALGLACDRKDAGPEAPPPVAEPDATPEAEPAPADPGTAKAPGQVEPVACTNEQVDRIVREQEGHGLDEDGGCVERPEPFPRVVLAGSFAHDRGCMHVGTLVDCALVERAARSAPILASVGWAEAKGSEREALALRYLREVELAFAGSVLDKPAPPAAKAEADGSVKVELWIQRPSGMQPVRNVDRVVYSFTPTGELSREVAESRQEDL